MENLQDVKAVKENIDRLRKQISEANNQCIKDLLEYRMMLCQKHMVEHEGSTEKSFIAVVQRCSARDSHKEVVDAIICGGENFIDKTIDLVKEKIDNRYRGGDYFNVDFRRDGSGSRYNVIISNEKDDDGNKTVKELKKIWRLYRRTAYYNEIVGQ